ncbi:MAG: enoyl-CoA hydratase-related protein [Candidatus Saccharimonadaceae bacterium]
MTDYKKYTFLNISIDEHICTVQINKPQALNALNTKILHELNRVFTEIENNNSIRVVIITGVEKSFVAGADIEEMSKFNEREGKAFGELGSDVFRKIELLNKPVIASINGYALGGGCELAMCCDIRIASEKAKFAHPEVGLGIIPGFSATQRLPRLVGMGRAKEMIFTGEVINATEAHRIGLVNKVTTPDKLQEETLQLAQTIASKAPLAIRYAKEVINRGMDTDIDTGIALEVDLFGICFDTQDQKKGMQAFLNKEKITFEGK